MTTTPQTPTLAGEDCVVLDDPDETWAPAELVRRIVEGELPVRVWRTARMRRTVSST